MTKLLVTFFSSHAAMEAELLMEEAGLPGRLIPLPPQVHAGCGLALLCGIGDQEAALALLARHQVPHENLYTGDRGGWEPA